MGKEHLIIWDVANIDVYHYTDRDSYTTLPTSDFGNIIRVVP